MAQSVLDKEQTDTKENSNLAGSESSNDSSFNNNMHATQKPLIRKFTSNFNFNSTFSVYLCF